MVSNDYAMATQYTHNSTSISIQNSTSTHISTSTSTGNGTSTSTHNSTSTIASTNILGYQYEYNAVPVPVLVPGSSVYAVNKKHASSHSMSDHYTSTYQLNKQHKQVGRIWAACNVLGVWMVFVTELYLCILSVSLYLLNFQRNSNIEFSSVTILKMLM